MDRENYRKRHVGDPPPGNSPIDCFNEAIVMIMTTQSALFKQLRVSNKLNNYSPSEAAVVEAAYLRFGF